MSTTAPMPPLRSQENPPLWRDVRVLKWATQIIVLAIVAWGAWWLYQNLVTNYEQGGLPRGFDFLSGRFGQAIPGLEEVSGDFSVQRAFLAGYLNTVRVILFGIPGCTIIGIVIGVMRLSDNVAARAFGTFYVETFRNIPVLVWIYLFHFAVLIGYLPRIDEASPTAGFVVSNRGIGIPWFNPDANLALFAGTVGLALLTVVLVNAWRRGVNEKTGEPSRGLLYGSIAFIAVLAAGHFISGGALIVDGSGIAENGRQIIGGMNVQAAYASLTVALTLYTASHVAEIVRGAILAINKGQTEAANAVALSTFQRYRFIILPQAFRIMIPPLANQYLNITKNSSLAVAVGFFDVTAAFQRAANNAAPAVQALLVLMGMYLTFSLGISLVANIINRRLSLVTR